MGLSKSKTKTTTSNTATSAPSTYSQPYIDSAAASLQPSFAAATANNNALMPRVNSTLDYFQNTMNQAPTANPYLESIIKSSNEGITNNVSSRFASAGRYGSGLFANTLAKAIGENENNLRYSDFTAQQGRSDAAARSLLGGVGVSAALPQAAASTYADQVKALVGGYGTSTSNGSSTSVTKPSILQVIAAAAAQAAASQGGG